jgi:predicted nucleic acid-binding protein
LKFLLDTNILSELRKPKPHGGVLAWFTASQSAGMAIPAIAIFEIQMGAEKVRENDPKRAAEFDFWIARLAAGSNVLPLDAESAREAARLLKKLPIALIADAMIAATAKVHGLIVATRNTKDFENFGVKLVNPFEHR